MKTNTKKIVGIRHCVFHTHILPQLSVIHTLPVAVSVAIKTNNYSKITVSL